MTVDLPRFHQLADLLQRPELLRPPPAVLPRLAWEGRCTLLAAPEKGGKSTLVGQGVAALAQGRPFLGEALTETPTLWFALDEPLGDLVRRLDRFGARRNVCVCQEVVGLHDLEYLLDATHARLLVADTLVEFFAGTVDAKDIYNPMAWQPVLKALRDLLQKTGCAAILLHHTTRDGSRYADSRQLGAGVDAIVTMSEEGSDPSVRKVDGRGRMIMERFRVRYGPSGYTLDEGELPLELRVYRVVEQEPGLGTGLIASRVGGRRSEVVAVLARLLARQAIRDEGDERRRSYFPTEIGRSEGSQVVVGTSRNADLMGVVPDPELSQVVVGTSRNGSGTTNIPGPVPGIPFRGSTGELGGPELEFGEPMGDVWEEITEPE